MPKNMTVCGVTGWKKVTVGSICGYWRQGRVGQPVLHLLHGNGFSGLSLLALGNALPEDWSLLLSDIPGHGGSAPTAHRGFPDWRLLAADLTHFVQQVVATEWTLLPDSGHLPRPEVVGVGHSMGGILTLMMAEQCPDLFQRLILLDPVLFPPALIGSQKLLQVTHLWRHNPLVRRAAARRARWESPAAAAEYLGSKSLYKDWHVLAFNGFLTTGLRPAGAGTGAVELACAPQWEALIFASAPLGLWRAVRNMPVPVHLLVATTGFSFIAPGARRAARLNPLMSVETVAGNHCFPMEHPEPTARRMVALCSTIDTL
ncbi:alpha/beta fold hydrolase [Oceanobacter sp. 4_MG-2023]|uniref:alpha/beta fold hydrolase n=1 Tax=Oceanobacter sp. 4_MG-2023 TaxID=3062623 RepID=UPI002735202B|nr:alpha/beta hydrolase [Oceanobacter sp. 4_MG-2023]MDP2549249.1 alpha/beta hydrolase [Oceanobacter sp. 4_MG-2023]